MLERILELNHKFQLNLTISEINGVVGLTDKEIKTIEHVPVDRLEFYKTELLVIKLLVFVVNKQFEEKDCLKIVPSQSSLKINLVMAKNMDNNEIIVDSLKTLLGFVIGDYFPHGEFTKEIFDIYNIEEYISLN